MAETLEVFGASAVIAGLALWSVPLALVVGGLIVILAALSLDGRKPKASS